MLRQEHQAELEADRHAMQRRLEEEQEQQYRQARVAACHKAQPVKKYKLVDVKPSDRPLTQPHTPNFSTRLRSRSSDN